MPNRIIKDSINESKGLSLCSVFAEDLYKRLITYADDYGRFNADTEIMLARLYPRELSFTTQEDIIDALIELAGNGKISFYTAKYFGGGLDGVYGVFPNWNEHQRVRDSKSKCPDPDDTTINDWYLRRFVSIDMKAQIIERDGFKCKICGKFVTTCRDARRFVKLGSGMYHIDHIVPCSQGGRATLENLRLSCPECNLSRKKKFSFEEIVKFAENGSENTQSAASCGELRQVAALIQSESNPNPNPNPIRESDAPAHACEKKAYGIFKNVFLSDEEYSSLCDKFRKNKADSLIDSFSCKLKSKGYKSDNHCATILQWADEDGVKPDNIPSGSFDTAEFLEAALKNSFKKEEA